MSAFSPSNLIDSHAAANVRNPLILLKNSVLRPQKLAL
jgi:hypothetical protein